MNAELIIQRLTQDNMALAEALSQSTEARGRQMGRIAQLERELADAHAQVAALEGARRVLRMITDLPDLPDCRCADVIGGGGRTLTDRDPWPDGGGYDAGEVWVRELEAAG